MTIYCRNPLCEWEAIYVYEREGEEPLPLCAQCTDAFELGQRSPDASSIAVEDWDQEA